MTMRCFSTTFPLRPLLLACLLALPAGFSGSAAAEPWHAQWRIQFPERKPAWEFTQRMGRDIGYPVAASGELAVVGCEHNGALLALDLRTGQERWRFHTAAPIRHAPAASDTHIYAGSDDGHLYCLDHRGRLVWKVRGGPSGRLVIGHQRLMSAWPVSASPLLRDGVLYFVSGYWPVDGIYMRAVDAASGRELWVNGDAELRPNRRIHWLDGKLLVEGDNSSAVFEAKTGKLLREKLKRPAASERPDFKGVPGSVNSWMQAGDLLVAGTNEGVVGCARSPAGELKEVAIEVASRQAAPAESAEANPLLPSRWDAVLGPGYALVAGRKDPAPIRSLLDETQLHVVVLVEEKDADSTRRQLDAAGLFDGHRLAVVSGEQSLPAYFSSLIVAQAPDAPKSLRRCLHPYRGMLFRISSRGDVELSRGEGPPAGSADWTHEFCDAANSLASPDQLVKAPLGLLWYGGEAADERFYFDGKVDHQSGHGLNPQPVPAQVIDGRMILQGPGLLAAIDIYTGLVLWETPLPEMYTFGGGGGGLGIHSKKHPRPWEHEEAMNFEVTPVERCRASGFNCVSRADGIYVAAAERLLRFDPATGELLSQWKVPIAGDLRWGNVRVSGDVLVATLFRPRDIADAQAGFDGNGGDWAGDRMPMSHLVAVDRKSGELIWRREADWGFLNRSGICVGGGRVYCVDLITEKIHQKYQEAGRKLPATPPTLHALELATGEPIWKYPLDVYVQNIAYSEDQDLLLTPCRNLKEWRDGKWVDLSIDIRRGSRNKNAAGKWRALRGADGQVVWEQAEAAYHSPHILLGELIIDRWGNSYDLNTGQRHLRTSPETGEQEQWSFKKGGCNHLIACQNLVTWRCAYYDLQRHRSVKLTGMDAGCSPTLIPAGGILNVPNFGTHHKRNRMTAMALIHVGQQ